MPPSLEPIRERILAAIAARLGTIAGGDDYFTTPAITRALLEIDQYKDAELLVGVLGVMRSEGSTLTPESHVDDSGRVTFQHLFKVAVYGYVIGDPDGTPNAVPAGTRLERLWEDHVKCLLLDDELGGLVIDLSPDPEPTSYRTDRGGKEPRAWFEQRWVAKAHEPFAVA